MSNIDQFESVFKSASKERFRYEKTTFRKVLVVTDLNKAEAKKFGDQVGGFIHTLGEIDRRDVAGSEFKSIGDLLKLVQKAKPDLICTYRNLHSNAWKWPHSLGSNLDVLTQGTHVPVLVMPHPKAGRALKHALHDTDSVMVITSHLVGDHSLVNTAVRFTEAEGSLHLAHIEDRHTFEHVIDAISKIPTIDTDTAREALALQFLKEPREYIRSCKEALEKEGLPIHVHEIVTMGTRLVEFKKLIENQKVDLLVMHTKHDDQLAMHGMAYPLAIELREVPLLMI